MSVFVPKSLSISMAAKMFGPTETQLRNWLARGILHGERVNGRVFIKTADLEATLAVRTRS